MNTVQSNVTLYSSKPRLCIRSQEHWYPYGICYDKWNRHIIVTDNWNSRILIFDSNTYQSHSYFGSEGSEPGQFIGLQGLCIQPFTHYLLVCDPCNNRIQVLSNDDYSFIYQIGCKSKSEKKGQFDDPCGVCCDDKGHILVADTSNDRIQEFNESGQFLNVYYTLLYDIEKIVDICYDKEYHRFLVADRWSSKIGIWSHDTCSKSRYISEIQLKNNCHCVYVDPLRNHQIIIGTDHQVLVYDSRNHKEPIQTLGSSRRGSELDEFDYVTGICVNEQDGSLIVVNRRNCRIQIF